MSKEFTIDEEYITSESRDIRYSQTALSKIITLFPALGNRNYQLYFSGQLVSLIGTWLQIVAQSWLVLELTNSAFLIGLVAAVATAPTLIFSLFGGVIVDRFPKRKVLLFTQSSAMILALILGVLSILKIINLTEVMILAFLLGVVTAIDSPARQAFVVELVGKEMLPSAIALNSGIFNGARVIGPSIAGFLIAASGVGGAFLLNGLSYIAVIIALLFITVVENPKKQELHPLLAIKQGISYAFSHPVVRTLLLFAAVTSIFGWSYTTIMPVIAKQSFHLNATGLGYLYAASGLGALIATILVSAFSKKVDRAWFILGGNALFCLALFIFTLMHALLPALLFLFFSGTGLIAQFSMMNTTIQSSIDDAYRGRVMSLYTIMFLGLSPFGNLQIGFVSEHFGTNFAIRLGVIVVFLFGGYLFFNLRNIRKAQAKYESQQ